ncbi:hypothetical protein KY334_00925, partial [Candidatus Woesearchaeota archaeon]|nr:hypothetical protein [Candidatus Woesearchaeota archaeon]
VEELESNLENSNYLKEIPEIITEEVEKTKYFFGSLGKHFGWKKVYVEEIERKIIKKANLKEAVPKIVDDLSQISSTLEKYTKELRGVIKKRNSYIDSLEKEVIDCVSSYNVLKLNRDDLNKELDKVESFKLDLEQYLATHDHTDKEYSRNEERNVSLLKRYVELENDLELVDQDIRNYETLKTCLEHKMDDAIRDNLGMELYVKRSDYARVIIEHQKKECSIGGMSFYVLASEVKQLAQIGVEMSKVSNVNGEMIGSLKGLLNRDYFNK